MDRGRALLARGASALSVLIVLTLAAAGPCVAAEPRRGITGADNDAFNAGTREAVARKWQAAAASFVRATRLDPSDADAFLMLGRAYRALGRPKDAVAAFATAVRLSGETDARVELLDARIDAGDYQPAIREAKALLETQPDHTETRGLLGLAYAKADQCRLALPPLRRYVAARPGDLGGYFWLGQCLDAESQHREALATYRRALALDADFAPAHFGLAMAALALGDRVTAEAERLRLAALDSALTAKLDAALAR
jgi:cytochrome c-type biogenesis protein CcmH/NrfG